MGWTVLITNNTLDCRAGSELYVRDIALGLRARGHAPIAYSTVLGGVAAELRRATVPVIDDLDRLGIAPDIIHGHHHLETVTASLRFPQAPVLSFCHGWLPWEEIPAVLPTVVRHVAVDVVCRDRLVHEHAIAPERVSLLYNFVDLQRFRPRGPLPARPARALVFSNAAGEKTFLETVREACARRGITVEVAGAASCVLERPEEALDGFDIVFAKARAAMEAMAVGCAVVLCDRAGAGPLVTSKRFLELRELNFGIGTLRHPHTVEGLGAQIDRFDPGDAARVRGLMREHGDLERRLDELLALYRTAVETPRPPIDPGALAHAAAGYLRWLSPRIKGFESAQADARHLRGEVEALAGRVGELTASGCALARDLDAACRAPGMRVQNAIVGLPVLGALARAISRRVFR